MKKFIERVLSLVLIVFIIAILPSYKVEASESIKWIDGNYTNYWWFKNGLAKVMGENGKIGYINKDGKLVIPMIYDNCGNFSEGYAWVNKDGKEGLIDTKGNIAVPIEYEAISNVSDGLFAFKKDGLYGFMDVTGNIIIPAQYKRAYQFSDGLAPVSDKEVDEFEIGNWGYVDNTGKIVIPCQYQYISHFYNGMALALDNEQNAIFIDKSNKKLDTTLIVPNLSVYFSEGMISLCELAADNSQEFGKMSVVDTAGNVILKGKYDYIGEFSSGLSPASNGGDWGFGGPIILEGSYDGGKWGYTDKNGKLVIPMKYDFAEKFYEGYGRVSINTNVNGEYKRLIGFVDKYGKEIVAPKFAGATPASEGVSLVRLNNKIGILDFAKSYEASGIPSGIKAEPTDSSILVNSAKISFEAYSIDGNNYFKLRDIAMAVTGSNKQFDVSWNNDKNAIELISQKPYTAVGGELTKGDNLSKLVTESTAVIFKDGKEIKLKAYSINGNNYFKLRDLCEAFNIGVDWDEKANTVIIDTSKDYIK